MKKTIITAAFLAIAAWANAQQQAPLSYMYDAASYTMNNYYGTARSLALGNAMTAVGGDMGSYGINPAGSAVATYGQFVFSPGFSTSVVDAGYASVGSMASSTPLSDRDRSTQAIVPNAGISLVLETGSKKGLKSFSFAFLVNRTASYNQSMAASGRNDRTSLLSEFAATASANSYSHDVLNSYDGPASWDLVTAYRARLFGGVGDNWYAGNSAMPVGEDFAITSPLNQSVQVMQSGSKSDVLINVGLNISDKLYLGFNCGVPNMERSYSETYSETPVDCSLFFLELPDKNGNMVQTLYKGAAYSYGQRIDMKGAYTKFGAIWVPVRGIRLGVAVQTPARLTVTEKMSYSAYSVYDNAGCGASCTSPEDEWSFSITTPAVFDLGAAVTLGQRLLLSLDCEMMDYSSLRMHESGPSGIAINDYFSEVNSAIRKSYGVSKAFRTGAEYRLSSAFSARAGYCSTTEPLKDSAVRLNHSAFSLGFGYASSGSFYTDFAIRWNRYPEICYMPFYDYDHLDGNGGLHLVGDASEELSPRVRMDRKMTDVVFTLGWRF